MVLSCRTLVYGVSLLIRVSGMLIMAMDKVMMPTLMEPPRILRYMHMGHMLVMRNTLNRQVFWFFFIFRPILYCAITAFDEKLND